jgi:hypothetical protein
LKKIDFEKNLKRELMKLIKGQKTLPNLSLKDRNNIIKTKKIMNTIKEKLQEVKNASFELVGISLEKRNKIISDI